MDFGIDTPPINIINLGSGEQYWAVFHSVKSLIKGLHDGLSFGPKAKISVRVDIREDGGLGLGVLASTHCLGLKRGLLRR